MAFLFLLSREQLPIVSSHKVGKQLLSALDELGVEFHPSTLYTL